MDTKILKHVLTTIPSIMLATAYSLTAAEIPQVKKPAPAATTATIPLTKDILVGAWMGEIALPNSDGSKGGTTSYSVILAFYSDGKCGVGFIETKTGSDFPATGSWKLKGGAVVFTPDSSDDPDAKPFALALTQPTKGQLIFDLECMGIPGKSGAKRNAVTLHSATDKEVGEFLGGERPN